MINNLNEKAKQHILVTAHRGVAAGNIPCNTIASYEIALKQGADIIETDVSCSADGKLFIFHPGMEYAHLNRCDTNLSYMPYDEIIKMHYVNGDKTETQFTIESFDDFLETFKNRCYINIDKFWSAPLEIYQTLKRHNMIEQCIVKSHYSEDVFNLLENSANDIPFMLITADENFPHQELMNKNINYIGAEVLFYHDGSYLASNEFTDRMHKDSKLVWVNSIIYDYKQQIAAGHSDDTALTESEDEGWGFLADRGFDIIQTDWTGMLIDYLKRSGKYYK